MSDYVNLGNPVRSTKIKSRTGVMTDALVKFGSVLVFSGSAGFADMSTTTTAGDPLACGVCGSQGDPNNSGLFAVGDEVTCVELGDHPVLVAGGTTLARGDRLIASTVAGQAKKIASETGDLMMIGESLEDVTTGTNPQLVSCRILMQRIKL